MRGLDSNIFRYINEAKSEVLNFDGLEFIEEYIAPLERYTLLIDAVLLKNKEVLAIFEFKYYQDELRGQVFFESQIPNSVPYKYFIVSNGRTSYVLNTFNGETFQTDSIPDLISRVSDIPNSQQTENAKSLIAKTITVSINTFFENEGLIINKNKKKYNFIKEHFSYQNIFDSLIFDRNGQFFKMSEDIRDLDNFENRFFNILLDDLRTNTKVYRYTTIDTVFSTVNKKTIRMNGIVGMNDISEVEYVDRYLDKTSILFTDPDEIKIINRRFITCCSTLSDNLNQWRLYGDDCKGACLVFKVLNYSKLPGLQLKRISYGTRRNDVNFHLELELIKFILDEVRLKAGQSLRFRTLEIWKHFFKSYEYKEEKEVRLLLILNESNHIKGESQSLSIHNFEKEWNLTSSHKILAPYITVPLFDKVLPIRLEKIILGSKCPEKALNQKQLQLFLKEKKLNDITTEISIINNYR